MATIAEVGRNPVALGTISLVWLALRTGTKPSRINYPCQRAALAQGTVLLTCFVMPWVASVPKIIGHVASSKKILLVAFALLIVATPVLILLLRTDEQWDGSLRIEPKEARVHPASKVFVVGNVTEADCYPDVQRLIAVMASEGLRFYESRTEGNAQGPTGLIARDDVVLIKVNCQWSERGGTNTDLVKALIRAVLEHPDGFVGEIVIADNGQGRGSLSWQRSNAEDQSQSFEKLAQLFSPYRVSTYLWDDIAGNPVSEYSEGDLDDGYVVTDIRLAGATSRNQNVSYPKFSTKYGTYVSFKEGIWDPESKSYNSTKLKVINVPVLKSHSVYGFTAAIKHYMGVVSQSLTNAHALVGQGAMGTELANTRYPVLNVVDAIWINARPRAGPDTSYSEAIRTNLLIASTDPIALDTWAVTHVLLEAARRAKYVSGSVSDFEVQNSYLGNTMNELMAYGYQVVMDEDQIEVCVASSSPES